MSAPSLRLRQASRSLLAVRRLLAYAGRVRARSPGARVAVVPAEVCPPSPPPRRGRRSPRRRAGSSAESGPDGRYTYGYDREPDLVSEDYNITRHAGVMMASTSSPPKPATRGTGGGRARLAFLPPTSSGTTTGRPSPSRGRTRSWARARSSPRARPAAPRHRRRPARTSSCTGSALPPRPAASRTAACWGPGAVRRQSPVPGEYSTFGTGQTLWAFALLDELFPGEGWGEPRGASPATSLRAATTSRATTSPSPTTGSPTGSPSSGRTGSASRRSPTRELAGILGLNSRLESQSGRRPQPDHARRAGLGRRARHHDRGARAAVAAEPRRPAARRPDRGSGGRACAAPPARRSTGRSTPSRRRPRHARCSRAAPGSPRAATRRWTTSATRSRGCSPRSPSWKPSALG